jgi:hypothetical protein
MCNIGPEDVGRCAKPPRGVADHCRVVGELCMKADECCAGATCRAAAGERMRCQPGGSGCAGYPCVVAAQCCGGWCLPDGSGGFSCRDACAPAGAGCAASADCCNGSCVGAPGATVCAGGGAAPPEPVCVNAGDACVADPGACSAGTVCAQVDDGAHACAPVTSQ